MQQIRVRLAPALTTDQRRECARPDLYDDQRRKIAVVDCDTTGPAVCCLARCADCAPVVNLGFFLGHLRDLYPGCTSLRAI